LLAPIRSEDAEAHRGTLVHGVEPDLALLVEFDAQIADRRSGLELGGGILIGTAPSIRRPARPNITRELQATFAHHLRQSLGVRPIWALSLGRHRAGGGIEGDQHTGVRLYQRQAARKGLA
jgi:hypothetical protein